MKLSAQVQHLSGVNSSFQMNDIKQERLRTYNRSEEEAKSTESRR